MSNDQESNIDYNGTSFDLDTGSRCYDDDDIDDPIPLYELTSGFSDRFPVSDESIVQHPSGCLCKECHQRKQLEDEIRTVEQAISLIEKQADAHDRLNDYITLRDQIELAEELRDDLNELIENEREIICLIDELSTSNEDARLFLDTGDETWLQSLYVDEMDPNVNSRKWQYSAVDPTVDEPRFSSVTAGAIIAKIDAYSNPNEALKTLVWICKAYRLTFEQFETIRALIREARNEIQLASEQLKDVLDWEADMREAETKRRSPFNEAYAEQECFILDALRHKKEIRTLRNLRRNTQDVREYRRLAKNKPAGRYSKRRGQKRMERLPDMMRTA